MPSSMLFGISTEGKVYGLSTNGKKWREFPYLGLEFKKISSVPSFLWALGGDRQIYLHVHSLDIPIRIKEEVYENERWFPIEGFGKRLLPTDRYHWSNKDGTVERRKENIRLPSMAWQWESDWQLELTLDGYPLDFDGWTYAIDFPTSYVPNKQWSSCVRRRKWYRYRRYGAMYAWCAIPPLHKDPTKEPFIDVCIGGYSKLDENKGMLSVWAVTVYGRIMFRNGVSTECPDGTRWLSVPSPKSSEVRGACCSAIGVLWIVLDNGGAAVRYGITSQCLTGETWLEVLPPEKNLKLVQISAGLNSVWAMTNDNRVWFRKGIRADRSHASEELLKGSGWIEMVAEMISISVSAHEQVFAINKKDKRIYYRSGVDGAELTGRKWRLIEARTQVNLPNSEHSSLSSLPNDDGDGSMSSENADEKTSRSAPPYAKFDAMLLTESEKSKHSEKYEIDSSYRMRSWSPIRGGGSLLAMEALPGTNDSSLDADTQNQVFREKDDLSIGCQKLKTLWGCVCAGAVTVDSLSLPKWFTEESVIEDYDEKEPWRSKILMKLKSRNLSESKKFENYEIAVETTSWIKSGKFKINLPGSQVLVECLVELEWIENNATGPDSGTLSVLSCNKETSLLQLSLSEITCILNCSEPGQPCFTVNTFKTVETDTTPLKCFFTSENDFEDWLDCISTVCNQVNGLSEVPHERSIWCTTRLGDIYVTDAELLKKNQATENGRFAKEYKVKNFFELSKISLLNGFPINGEITVNGYVPANADRFAINLVCGTTGDIAFHFNPRLIEQTIVRNSNIGKMWGPEEREGSSIILPGSDFTITILCLEKKYKVFINGLTYTYYQHRISPETITDVEIGGQVDVFNILYETDKVILNLYELIWRKIEGNLHKVETCSAGITWGLGYNCVPWVYTSSWRRNISKPDGDKSSSAKYTMIDTKEMHVYENQRWNPLTGFTTRGLPTDRYMWSDETGREKLTKDSIKLQPHWQWVNEWQIDYKTPGGVDQDGWQYAVDFPASYHPHNNITDTVRRRRWVRTCRIVIQNSPWQEIGNTKLKDVSLSILDSSTNPKSIAVWGVTINGEVLYRSDVTTECFSGEKWEHVEIDQAIRSISVGGTRQVWCCGENGVCFWRFGITPSNPIGENWQYVEPINGCFFHKVAVGKWTVWALDTKGELYIRKEITPVFPEGTHWRKVQNNDNHKFKHVSASEEFIWAVTNEGVICRRIGISEEYPEGLSWIYGLSGDWLYLSEK